MKLALISAYKLTLCRKRISRKTPLASKALYKGMDNKYKLVDT